MSKNMTREQLVEALRAKLGPSFYADIDAAPTEDLQLDYDVLIEGEKQIRKYGSSMVADWAETPVAVPDKS
ncbi:MAG: hypothetical protein LBR29_04855 [Methylobacteriaceae bacterium]|nr:hypothetical protein [Methylobacteriaceae bacterium]